MTLNSTHQSPHDHDSAKDLSVAVELKFLIPFLPRGGDDPESGSGNLGCDGNNKNNVKNNVNINNDNNNNNNNNNVDNNSNKNHNNTNSSSNNKNNLPPLETIDYIVNPRAISEEKAQRLLTETFSRIAATIKQVAGVDAISSIDLQRLGRKERDCWAGRWVVKKSNSAEPSSENAHHGDCVWVPVEINSPRLRWRDDETFAVVRRVLRALRTRYRLVSNYTCEVHVHAGRMDGKAFRLTALKRIALLSWLAEPTLRLVKDPKSPNFDHVYTWSSAARVHSRLAKQIRHCFCGGKDNSTTLCRPVKRGVLDDPAEECLMPYERVPLSVHQHALKLIWETTSHIQLGRLMSGEDRSHRRLGFNFSAMGEEDERARTNPRTIECRFLEGTVDEEVVLGWMRIFGTLVKVGLDPSESQGRFAKTVSRLAAEEELGQETPPDEAFHKLMEDLGVDETSCRPVEMMIGKIYPDCRSCEVVESIGNIAAMEYHRQQKSTD